MQSHAKGPPISPDMRLMVIQRETEEFRASKTHSALVDQSYQFAVIQDIKGVPYPVAQELNRRALVVLIVPACLELESAP